MLIRSKFSKLTTSQLYKIGIQVYKNIWNGEQFITTIEVEANSDLLLKKTDHKIALVKCYITHRKVC